MRPPPPRGPPTGLEGNTACASSAPVGSFDDGDARGATRLLVTPDDAHLVIAGPRAITVWATATGRLVWDLTRAPGPADVGLWVSRDGRGLVAAAPTGDAILLRAWDLGTGRRLRTTTWPRALWQLELWSTDDEHLVLFLDADRRDLQCWNVRTGRQQRLALGAGRCTALASRGRSFALSPDGRQVVLTISQAPPAVTSISIWDLETQTHVRTLECAVGPMLESTPSLTLLPPPAPPAPPPLAISPNGKYLVAWINSDITTCWRLEDPRALWTVQVNAREIRITTDSLHAVVIADDDHGAYVVDLPTGHLVATLCDRLHPGPTATANVALSTRRMCMQTGVGCHRMWDTRTWRQLDAPGMAGQRQVIALSSDGRFLFRGLADGPLTVYEDVALRDPTIDIQIESAVDAPVCSPTSSDDQDPSNENAGGVSDASLQTAEFLESIRVAVNRLHGGEPNAYFRGKTIANSIDVVQRYLQLYELHDAAGDGREEVRNCAELDEQLASNATTINKIDAQLLGAERLLREKLCHDDTVRKNDMHESLREHLRICIDHLVNLQKHRGRIDASNEALKSIVCGRDTMDQPRKAQDLATLRHHFYRVVTKASHIIPVIIRLLHLQELLAVWVSKELTWFNMFSVVPYLSTLADVVHQYQATIQGLAAEEQSLRGVAGDAMYYIDGFSSSIAAIARDCTDESSRKHSIHQDLAAIRFQLLKMDEMARISDQVRACKQLDRNTESQQHDAMKLIDTLAIETKACRDLSEIENLQQRKDDGEVRLTELARQSRCAVELLTQYSQRLLEPYPDLVVDNHGQWGVVTDTHIARHLNIINERLAINRYRLVKWLVMDKVMLMKDPFGQLCVMKKLIGFEQVRRQAERLRRLQHPLIVRINRIVLDSMHPDSICYMEMPFYEYGNLRSWERMQKTVSVFGHLPDHQELVEVRHTFHQISQALAHIHAKGVTHYDLKPENVLVAKGGRLVLCGFGISSDFGTESGKATMKTTTDMAGTMGYMAPELRNDCHDWRKCPSAVDLWSLGCMLLELILPVFPQALGTSQVMLTTIQPQKIDWSALIMFFGKHPHMQALCRLCSQLLRENPDERLTVYEVLLEQIVSPTYGLAAVRYDPVAQSNLVFSRLVATRTCQAKPLVIQLVGVLTTRDDDASSLSGSAVCRCLFSWFSQNVPDLHVPFEFRDERGNLRSLGEMMDVFFTEVVLPGHGLFTQLLGDETGDHVNQLSATRAFLPAITGDQCKLRVVGMLLAKCLVEGIRIPIVLNSSCLDVLVGRVPVDVDAPVPVHLDECLSYLLETNDNETMLYRNILLSRQHERLEYPLEVGVLLSSDSHPEQFVTEENKQRVVVEAIWSKLVRCRLESLRAMVIGFRNLDAYAELQAIPGRELQRLFYGNDYVDVDVVQRSVRFIRDAWSDVAQMAAFELWFGEWLGHASDVTLRLLLLRIFHTHIINRGNVDDFPQIGVVPSDRMQVCFVARGVIALPLDCSCYEIMELRIGEALGMWSRKSTAERRQQLDQDEWIKVVGAMRGEIRAGGWYQCPSGHVYAVGECGGPMQTATCPECGSGIGGQGHQLATGNTRADVDDLSSSALPL